MSAIRAVRTGLTVLGKIDRKYNINKIFIEKYVPPGYRKLVSRIFDIGITSAGIVSLYDYLSTPSTDTTGGSPVQQQERNYSQSQKYSGRNFSRSRSRRRDYCKPRNMRRKSYWSSN